MPITKATASSIAPAAKGDLVVGSATNDASVLAVGSANQVLTVDSSTATGLKWAAAAGGPTFTTYTPTWTNLTVGNGTVTAASATNGDLAFLYVKIVFGSTTAITGGVQFTLPTNAHSTMNALQFYSGSLTDSGARTIGSVGQITNTLDKVTVLYQDDAAGYIDLFVLSSTAPWTWNTGDEMQFFIEYRKA